jgi:hypothetical protein
VGRRKPIDLTPEEDAPLKTGAGLAGFGQPVTPQTSTPVNGLTSVPPRVTAGYKIDADVKRQFARFVKWHNRDRDPADETDMGVLAQEALEDLMRKYGYQEATP